ncbi:MAG: TIGR00341 family protein, partial [Chitinophagaceae bacterium]
MRDRFNLDEDKAEEELIVESIKRDVHFKGTNLWTLLFAIMIASIGLNVNSTAVIIGAMLISPLMGPIMGI